MNVRERRSILPLNASAEMEAAEVDDKVWGLGAWTKCVGKCKQFDFFRLADLGRRRDRHSGSAICDWLHCYYQPVVIQHQGLD